MESKKPNTAKGRQRLHVPQRSSSASASSRMANTAASPSPHSAKPSSRQKSKPSLSLSKRSLFSKKTIIAAGVVIAVAVAGGLVRHYSAGESPPNPEYQTILPEGKSPDELGGWQRISPPGTEPVFAFADKIGDVPISVSQQPLPASFRGDTATHVADLAKKFNATTEIKAGDIIVYVGTSAKGPQSAILTKNDLLIMIKSQQAVSNKDWAKYAESLD